MIKVSHLTKLYNHRPAVKDVSFEIRPGETLGLVGESGSGKSTTGKLILKLEEPTSGEILYDNAPLHNLNHREMLAFRKRTQIIFQDSYSSLNPRMTVEKILEEPFAIHNLLPKRERKEKAVELLTLVGLESSFLSRFPHELSGGQRQRICIARALSLSPQFVVCDEPISSLDVSVGAQITLLLQKLQQELGLTCLLISHDLSMVRHLSNRIAVMYQGSIVEIGESEELFTNPQHPYTQTLLSSLFVPDPKYKKKKPYTAHS